MRIQQAFAYLKHSQCMYTQQLQDNTRWHQQQQEKKVIVIKTGKEKQ